MKNTYTAAERRRYALVRCYRNYGLLSVFRFLRLRRVAERHWDAEVRKWSQYPEMTGYLQSRLEDLGEAGTRLHRMAERFWTRAVS